MKRKPLLFFATLALLFWLPCISSAQTLKFVNNNACPMSFDAVAVDGNCNQMQTISIFIPAGTTMNIDLPDPNIWPGQIPPASSGSWKWKNTRMVVQGTPQATSIDCGNGNSNINACVVGEKFCGNVYNDYNCAHFNITCAPFVEMTWRRFNSGDVKVTTH